MAAQPEAAFCRLGPRLSAALGSFELVESAFAAPALGVQTPAEGSEGATAAVLVPLLMVGERPAVVMIRRASGLRSGPGEIAFPGGHVDDGEAPEAAALREAEEEIGLPPRSVRVVGELPPVSRRTAAISVAAFVGLVEDVPALTPNLREVDEVLVVPLGDLADPLCYEEELWAVDGSKARRMHFFALGDDLLWGLSARILVSLLDRLAAAAGGPK